MEFVNSKGIDRIYAHEMSLCDLFIKRVENIEKIRVYRPEKVKSLPVVSFTAGDENSSVTADMLSKNGFYLRGGCLLYTSSILSLAANICIITVYISVWTFT